MVVLPDPVGPVTNTIPSVLLSEFLRVFKTSSLKPKSSKLIFVAPFSNIRRTILSPKEDGSVDTLKSISLLPKEIEILPS